MRAHCSLTFGSTTDGAGTRRQIRTVNAVVLPGPTRDRQRKCEVTLQFPESIIFCRQSIKAVVTSSDLHNSHRPPAGPIRFRSGPVYLQSPLFSFPNRKIYVSRVPFDLRLHNHVFVCSYWLWILEIGYCFRKIEFYVDYVCGAKFWIDNFRFLDCELTFKMHLYGSS